MALLKVLVVDDDPTYRRLLTTILVSTHHDVVEATDGQNAWELLQSGNLQFVITDWMMPGMDGPELVECIRKANFVNYIYIILLTARNARSDVVGGLESGADDYLTKPFDLDELRARVAIGDRILNLERRLREALEREQRLATHDSLTNMFNRRALCEFAEEEISRARRENRPVSLVLMDLDHFKQVNDEHGHLFGDQALCLVANIISRHKRDYDKAGRWGGEEFLLVLPGTNKEEACQVAERLRAEIASAKLQLPPNEGYLSIHGSFGVSSSSPGDELTFDRLIQQADEALYCAKRDGRNRVYPRPENELPAS